MRDVVRPSIIVGVVLAASVLAGCQTTHGTKSVEELRKCEETRDQALGLIIWQDFHSTGTTVEQAKAEYARLEQQILHAYDQCIKN